jgi:hypothetical protein
MTPCSVIILDCYLFDVADVLFSKNIHDMKVNLHINKTESNYWMFAINICSRFSSFLLMRFVLFAIRCWFLDTYGKHTIHYIEILDSKYTHMTLLEMLFLIYLSRREYMWTKMRLWISWPTISWGKIDT